MDLDYVLDIIIVENMRNVYTYFHTKLLKFIPIANA